MTIPTEIVTDLASTTVSVMNGNIPLITILFGIGIAFFIANKIVKLIPKR